MPAIVIVDYGMANLRSVQKAFEKVGFEATITPDLDTVAKAEKLVLPGVGAFRDAIARLRDTGLDALVKDHVKSGRKFLGICLGLQLLFTKSYEDGEHAGLDLFAGEVVRFEARHGLKIPHMGWNQIRRRLPAPLLTDEIDGRETYFVHAYYAKPKDPGIIAAETDYPEPFTSAIWSDNVFATQFHPEKSQKVGLEMLRLFAEWR